MPVVENVDVSAAVLPVVSPKRRGRLWRDPLVVVLALLALSWFWSLPPRLDISDARLIGPAGSQPIVLPYSGSIPDNYTYQIAFDVEVAGYRGELFSIIPDDCLRELRVDGAKIDLSGIKGLCDYGHGFEIDLAHYLHKGKSHVEATLWNGGGSAGLTFGLAQGGLRSLGVRDYAVAGLFLLALILLLHRLRLPITVIACILFGVVLRLGYFSYTGQGDRTYDVGGHLEYIALLGDTQRVPEPDACWSCYHPPVYYAGGALVRVMASWHDLSWAPRLLQQAHLLMSVLTLVLGILLLRRMLGNGGGFVMAALVWASWPGFVLTAPRIGNDGLFFLGQIFAMLFAQRWWETRKPADMLWATLGVCVALMAKSTGMVSLMVWGILVMLGTLRDLRLPPWRTLLAMIGMLVVAVGLGYSRMLIAWWDGATPEMVGNAHSLNGALAVGNRIGNYLYFDLKDFLTEPWASPWQDSGGRQFFWNYAFKTSLFGEFRLVDSVLGAALAGLLSWSGLIAVAVALRGLVGTNGRDLPLLLVASALFSALMLVRIQYPYSCSNDFRYVMPILLPVAYWAVRGVSAFATIRVRVLLFTNLLVFICLSSVLLLLPVLSVH